MREISDWLNHSRYIEPLSPACKMCANGSKMVLLITGLCPSNCFYCPLSREKLSKDRIFADEWELEDEKDTEKLILEAKYIDAEGAGITGGDPLIIWERTSEYIKTLKDNFGINFHIHLYTSGLKNYKKIPYLVDAGLDEIRFHPTPYDWADMENSITKKSIELSLDFDIDVAVEIPVLPDMKKEIIKIIEWSESKNIKWINLNELEFSETNAEQLNHKSYTVKDEISSAVKNSETTAFKVFDLIKNRDIQIGVHYCSSSFKDGVQLRNRILRRARNVSKKYETVSDDGTILKGIIISKLDSTMLLKELIQKYGTDNIDYNKRKNRIETSIEIVEEIKKQNNDFKCYIIEEYPTADRLEVERIPL